MICTGGGGGEIWKGEMKGRLEEGDGLPEVQSY